MAEVKKKKKKIKDHLRYLNPKNLISDIEKMGVEKPFRTIVSYYLVFIILLIISAIILNIKVWGIIIMAVAELLIVPLIIINHYKKGFEDKRFSEVSQYIEQMLYSFDDNKKILKSIQDIMPLFKNTYMGDALKQMEIDIEKEGLEYAISNFESKYDCQKITQLDKFLLEVEKMGGNHHNSIVLLLEDRAAWVERTLAFKKERNSKLITVTASIIVSYIICIIMEKLLPAEVDISQNVITQIMSVILFIVDLVLYYVADKKCSTSILNNLKTRKDSDIKRYYEYVVNYDGKREFVKGIKMLPIPLGISLFGMIQNNKTFVITGLILAIFFLFKYKISYKTKLKAIKEEIDIQFPRWLMQMALLAQSNSIQVAIYKSINEAGMVLKPELIKLSNATRENPTSVDPYLNFMADFKMPDITASLKMFYAIASGAGSNVEKQINDIVKRNNSLLDKSERLAFENSLAGMYMLFLAPQITGGAKLIVDMFLFFITFMASVTV